MTYDYKVLSLKEIYQEYLPLEINKDLIGEPCRIMFFKTSLDPNEVMLCFLEDKKIIAIACLESYDKYTYLKKYVSVDPAYKNKGLGKKLLEKLYEYASHHQYIIIYGKYSEEGEKYLKNKSIGLAKKYNVISFETINEYEKLLD